MRKVSLAFSDIALNPPPTPAGVHPSHTRCGDGSKKRVELIQVLENLCRIVCRVSLYGFADIMPANAPSEKRIQPGDDAGKGPMPPYSRVIADLLIPYVLGIPKCLQLGISSTNRLLECTCAFLTRSDSSRPTIGSKKPCKPCGLWPTTLPITFLTSSDNSYPTIGQKTVNQASGANGFSRTSAVDCAIGREPRSHTPLMSSSCAP